MKRKGLTGNLTPSGCTDLGFATVMYPCTGFVPAVLAMQRSYGMLKVSLYSKALVSIYYMHMIF
jgi:hypothetical protein